MFENLLSGSFPLLLPAIIPIAVKGVKLFVEQVLVGKLPGVVTQMLSVLLGAAATTLDPLASLSAAEGGVLGLAGVGAHQVYKATPLGKNTRKKNA